MLELRLSETYVGSAWIETLCCPADLRRIRVTQRAGLGLSFVLDEALDTSKNHEIRIRFHDEDDIGRPRMDSVVCTKVIKDIELNNIINSLAFADRKKMLHAISDVFAPSFARLINIGRNPQCRFYPPAAVVYQNDLFEPNPNFAQGECHG